MVATEGGGQGNADRCLSGNLRAKVFQDIQSLGARILGCDQYGRIIGKVSGEVVEFEALWNHLTKCQNIPQGGSYWDIVVLNEQTKDQHK